MKDKILASPYFKVVLFSLAIGATWLAVPSAATWALATAPRQVLETSGVDLTVLQPEALLKALTDSRTSVLSLLGSVVATAVACAALVQAHYARKAYVHKREIDWSSSFSSSSSMLMDKNPAQRLAAVAALCSLLTAAPEQSKRTVLTTLAAYVRSNALAPSGDEALRLAVETICKIGQDAHLSIAGANLSGLDLSGLNFAAINISSVNFRDSTISADQKDHIESQANVDTSGVRWRGSIAG